jgi:hypothetical protein
MHADDIEWADAMDAWKANTENKRTGRAGDDRSPAWRWLGSLYHNDEHLVMPLENIMRCLMEAGAMVPTGKGKKTFKSQSQSGIMPGEPNWPLLIKGKPIPFDPFKGLIGEKDFAKHKDAAIAYGFSLFLKRAKIERSKHVRVRPRFEQWQTAGELFVIDEEITDSILQVILTQAGRYKGLGDWRPSSATPGSYGMFTAEVKRV